MGSLLIGESDCSASAATAREQRSHRLLRRLQPHQTPARAGLKPQAYVDATGERSEPKSWGRIGAVNVVLNRCFGDTSHLRGGPPGARQQAPPWTDTGRDGRNTYSYPNKHDQGTGHCTTQCGTWGSNQQPGWGRGAAQPAATSSVHSTVRNRGCNLVKNPLADADSKKEKHQTAREKERHTRRRRRLPARRNSSTGGRCG